MSTMEGPVAEAYTPTWQKIRVHVVSTAWMKMKLVDSHTYLN